MTPTSSSLLAPPLTPPPAPKTAEDRDRKRGLKLSVGFHVSIAIFILVKSLVFPSESIPYIPTLRVDLVGLPDQLVNETIQPSKAVPQQDKSPDEPQPAPKEEVADPDEMVLNPKKAEKAPPKDQTKEREKKLKSALARIKALAKIQGDTSAQSASASATSGVLIKGNKISKGTSLSGEAREAAEASYYDLLRDKLQENWALPVWISRQNLSAQVQIFIDAYGRVVSYRFSRGSGNSQFDDAVKRTITESQPFSPPPAGLASSILTNGILVGFPL